MGFVRHLEREARDARIRMLRGAGLSLRQVAEAASCSTETVREATIPGLKERRNARRLERYHERKRAE